MKASLFKSIYLLNYLLAFSNAWVSPSPSLASASKKQKTSSPTILQADPGVMDFVNSLDSALGNPTSVEKSIVQEASTEFAKTTATAINLDSSLIAGGVAVAVVATLGFVLTRKGTDQSSSSMSSSNLTELENIMPALSTESKQPKSELPSLNVSDDYDGISTDDSSVEDDNSATASKTANDNKNKGDDSTVTAGTSDDYTVEDDDSAATAATSDDYTMEDDDSTATAAILDDDTKARIEELEEKEKESKEKILLAETRADELSADLNLSNEELEKKRAEIDKEVELRVATESKLAEANSELEQTAADLEQTQIDLLQIEEERKEIESQLEEAVESNRQLEDQYELEQNEKMVKIKELESQALTLSITRKELTKTQDELTLVKTEMETTMDKLMSTSTSLTQLQDDNKSLRKLGRKMWGLSKSRFSKRIQNVGNKLRRKKKD